MATLGLSTEKFSFDKATVTGKLVKGKIGNYALGYIQKKNGGGETFVVSYVGRSDTCLQARLLDHEHMDNAKCTHFKFKYVSSEDEAFQKECQNYHDFAPPLNEIHPQKPDEGSDECQYCE